jgi:hypothetical protein
MARTPEMNLHPRGSGDVVGLRKEVDDTRIIALAQGLLLKLNPLTGKSEPDNSYFAESKGNPYYTIKRAKEENATIEKEREIQKAKREAGRLVSATLISVMPTEERFTMGISDDEREVAKNPYVDTYPYTDIDQIAAA